MSKQTSEQSIRRLAPSRTSHAPIVEGQIDLHLHSTASDGVLTPSQLVAAAVEANLRIIALADHDSTQGIAEAQRAAKGTPLTVWPAVEISTDLPHGELHILGYFVRRSDPHFSRLLSRMHRARLKRARAMVHKLRQMGVELSWAEVESRALGGTVGRTHIAQAMLHNGLVPSASEAFRAYIGRNSPAYVERYRLSPVEAVAAIKGAGGIAVVAHPLPSQGKNRGDQYDVAAVLPPLIQAGLDGLEAYYPGYDQDAVSFILRLARSNGLCVTGGSDYHGTENPPLRLGDLKVPPTVAGELLCRARAKRGDVADPKSAGED